jgi:methyl-accepting chemotaxis protein
LGVVVLLSMSSMNQRSSTVTGDTLPSIAAVDDMTISINTLVRHQREHLTLTNAKDKAGTTNEIRKDEAKFLADAATFLKVKQSAADQAGMARVHTLYEAYVAKTARFVSLSNAQKIPQGAALLASADPTFSAITDELTKLAVSQDVQATADNKAISSSYSSARMLTLVLLGTLLLLSAGVAVVLTRGIKRGVDPVLDRLRMLQDHCATDLRTGLERMAAGDLTYEVTPVTPPIENLGGDEIGQVGEAVNGIRERTVASVVAYNNTRASLTRLVSDMQNAATTVSAASAEMASTSEETGRAVGEIANAIGDVAQGAERQVKMVEDARHATDETGRAAEQANTTAQEGVTASQQASAAMSDLRESTSQITLAIGGLAAKSDQIGGIVETITGIAGQTNLLALNAAIEAARAGEQGRGFAVVAEEVRKLAEESQKAAASIANLVEEIQSETARTVRVVEDGAAKAEESSVTVEAAREAFEQIGSAVDDMRNRIGQIVEATNEVAAVAEGSSASTEQLSASTEETSASAQQIAASAQDLARTAEALQDLVGGFTIA